MLGKFHAPNDVILSLDHGASEPPKILKPKATTSVTLTSHQWVGVRLLYSGGVRLWQILLYHFSISINTYLQLLV